MPRPEAAFVIISDIINHLLLFFLGHLRPYATAIKAYDIGVGGDGVSDLANREAGGIHDLLLRHGSIIPRNPYAASFFAG